MLWMLLVYVVASNGYASNPVISGSFHGATFATKEACMAAAATVSASATPGTEDVAKSGVVTVCAPAQPPPPDPPPVQALSSVPMQQSPFPAAPAHPGH
jgi:hypothetical protein